MPSEPNPTEAGVERFTISARRFRSLTIVSLSLIFLIIVVGSAVRLTGSGLGCADWPNCGEGSGQFIEFGNTNQTIEQANRLLSGIGGVAAAAIAVVGARRRRPYRRDLEVWSWGLVAGVLANIPLGGITVLVHLHPAAVASHFVLGMILLAIATTLVWKSSHEQVAPPTPPVSALQLNMSRLMVLSAVALMVTGPLVTGSGPHAGDREARRFGYSIGDATRIHSINMWVFLVIAVMLLVGLATTGAPADIMRNGTRMLVAILAQGAIGYTQYELGIPAWLVILHVAGACAVTATTLWFHLGLAGTRRSRLDAVGPDGRPRVQVAPLVADAGRSPVTLGADALTGGPRS